MNAMSSSLAPSSGTASSIPFPQSASDRCPTCDQVIPHDHFEEIQSRIQARQQEQVDDLTARRDALRAQGRLAGIGLSTCLEPSGGNAGFEPLFNPKNDTTVWMESSLVRVDMLGGVTVVIGTPSSGQGHETLAATIVAEELQLDPDSIRVMRSDSISALPGNTPVGSRMAIMIGGAATAAAREIRERIMLIGAHNLKLSLERVEYRDGSVFDRNDPSRALSWSQLTDIAHRKFH